MWKPLVVLAVSALALTGCAGAPQGPAEEPAPSGRITAPAPEETAAGEVALLETVRDFRAVPILDSASDEEIVAAANEACAQLAAGTSLVDVSIIDGDDPTGQGFLLAKTAHEHLCPDTPTGMETTP